VEHLYDGWMHDVIFPRWFNVSLLSGHPSQQKTEIYLGPSLWTNFCPLLFCRPPPTCSICEPPCLAQRSAWNGGSACHQYPPTPASWTSCPASGTDSGHGGTWEGPYPLPLFIAARGQLVIIFGPLKKQRLVGDKWGSSRQWDMKALGWWLPPPWYLNQKRKRKKDVCTALGVW